MTVELDLQSSIEEEEECSSLIDHHSHSLHRVAPMLKQYLERQSRPVK